MPLPKIDPNDVRAHFLNLPFKQFGGETYVKAHTSWNFVVDTLRPYCEFAATGAAPNEGTSSENEGGTSDQPVVRFHRLPHAGENPLPAYGTPGAAGMDLRAGIRGDDAPFVFMTRINPGMVMVLTTGFEVAIPPGYEGQVRPRSGLAAKHGVTVLNAPGTIDSDYRGEIKVVLVNHGRGSFEIEHGDRIAQLVIAPVSRAAVAEVAELDATERGEAGFGSTGVK